MENSPWSAAGWALMGGSRRSTDAPAGHGYGRWRRQRAGRQLQPRPSLRLLGAIGPATQNQALLAAPECAVRARFDSEEERPTQQPWASLRRFLLYATLASEAIQSDLPCQEEPSGKNLRNQSPFDKPWGFGYYIRMEKVTLPKIQEQLSAYIEKVRAGHSILIVDGGLPIARLEPVEGADHPDDRLTRLERAGPLRRSTWPVPTVLLRKAAPRAKQSVVQALLEERRETR